LEIVFDFPHVFSPDSSPAESANVERASRDLLTFVNRAFCKGKPGCVGPATGRRAGEFFSFNFPHVFTPTSSRADNAMVIRACLDFLIHVNEDFLSRRPPMRGLFDSGVHYERTTIWDSIPALYKRGYGDCKSLSAALIAQYRHVNRPALPSFRYTPRPGAGTQADYHILVQTEEGFEDPSKILGMPHGDDW